MIKLYAHTGVGGLPRYLRGHAEATYNDARQFPDLGRDLITRCFASSGQAFSYRPDRRGEDAWFNWGAGRELLRCAPPSSLGTLRPGSIDQICADCEDLSSWYAAAALFLGAFEFVEVGICPPPHEGAEGHAICRVGRQIADLTPSLIIPGLVVPTPGLWDPSAWHGMRPIPPAAFYETAEFLAIRGD